MPAQPKHREPIIDAAVRLFRRQGYASTGLNELVDASGAPKGSLYHYFPDGKISIAVAAVERAGERVEASLQNLSKAADSAAQLVRAHARQLGGWMRKSGYRDGCPITTVLLELCPQEREVSAAGRKAYAARLGVFAEKLKTDGWPAPEADRRALLCVSALQGALIQARVERSDAPLLAVGAQLSEFLEEGPPPSLSA